MLTYEERIIWKIKQSEYVITIWLSCLPCVSVCLKERNYEWVYWWILNEDQCIFEGLEFNLLIKKNNVISMIKSIFRTGGSIIC